MTQYFSYHAHNTLLVLSSAVVLPVSSLFDLSIIGRDAVSNSTHHLLSLTQWVRIALQQVGHLRARRPNRPCCVLRHGHHLGGGSGGGNLDRVDPSRGSSHGAR